MHLSTLARRAIIRLLPAATILIVFGGCIGTCQDNQNRSEEPSPWRPSTPEPECGPWQTACDGECVSTNTDPQHCGECGRTCDTGQYCAGGNCVDECEDPYVLCGDECVSLSNTPTHCGQCGNECRSDGASGYCSMSECRGWECEEGHFDTDGDRSNGCERECKPLELRDGERYDVQLPVVHVDGRVTIDGEPVPTDNPGFLLFESMDTESMAYVPVDIDGSYEAVLYAGYYRIHRVEDDDCDPYHNRCPNEVLREGLRLSEDTTLALNDRTPVVAPEVDVSGRIRVNGRALPDHPDSRRRAVVEFWSPNRSFSIEVGPNGAAVFSDAISAGRYDVIIEGQSCEYNELPCQRRIVAEDLEIREDTVFDWTFDSIEASGSVTVSGEPLSGRAQRDRYGALELVPVDRDSLYQGHTILLEEGDAGRFRTWMYPGTYKVGIQNQYGCPANAEESSRREIPCSYRELRSAETFGRGHELDIDLPVVRLTGEVTVNGQTMADSPVDRNRGILHIGSPLGSGRNGLTFGINGPASINIPLYAGEYTVQIVRQYSVGSEERVLDRVLPDDAFEVRDVIVERSQTLSIDLPVFEIEGRITLNGEPFVPQTSDYSVDAYPEFGSLEIERQLMVGEPASFSVKVYGDREYALWLESNCARSLDDPMPCGSRMLMEPFTPTRNLNRTFDWRPVQVSGQILLNGEPPGEAGSVSRLRLRSERALLRPTVDVDAQGRFEVLAYPGTYEVYYYNRPEMCDGAMPCGNHLFDRPLEVRAGEPFLIDVPTAEVRGDVRFTGSQEPYPVAAGGLLFAPEDLKYRVPVEDGSYGPVRFVEGSYHRVYQHARDDGEFWRESCTSTGDVPCHQYRIDVCQ